MAMTDAQRKRRQRAAQKRTDNWSADRMGTAEWSWQEDAACRNGKTEHWFPTEKQWTPEQVEARRVCREECPVRAQCLDFALSTNQEDGIWGGMTVGERKRLRRQRHRLRGAGS